VALLIIFVSWWTGWLRVENPRRRRPVPADEAPPPALPTAGFADWEPRQQNEEELAVQQERCRAVKARCLDAAQRLKAAQAASASEQCEDELVRCIDDLVAVKTETDGDGALGVIAMTELCNAVLEADALPVLDSLQQHANPHIASQSSALFQHVVPRIWSF